MSYFVPRDQAEKARFNLFEEGEYDAMVTKAETKKSQSGNEMVVFDLKVRNARGEYTSVTDYIPLIENMIWKYIHAADSAGLGGNYDDQTLRPFMFTNKRVRVKLKIEEGKEIPTDKLNGKPPGTKYYDKNKVDDYLTTEGQPKAQNRSAQAAPPPVDDEPPFDDDVPF